MKDNFKPIRTVNILLQRSTYRNFITFCSKGHCQQREKDSSCEHGEGWHPIVLRRYWVYILLCFLVKNATIPLFHPEAILRVKLNAAEVQLQVQEIGLKTRIFAFLAVSYRP